MHIILTNPVTLDHFPGYRQTNKPTDQDKFITSLVEVNMKVSAIQLLAVDNHNGSVVKRQQNTHHAALNC